MALTNPAMMILSQPIRSTPSAVMAAAEHTSPQREGVHPAACRACPEVWQQHFVVHADFGQQSGAFEDQDRPAAID